MNEPHLGTMASEVGPIPADGGDYLKFLVAVRTIVEAEATIAERRRLISELAADPQWKSFVRQLGGKDKIADRLFPPFLATIPGLSENSARALRKANLTTPARLLATADADLSKVPGIGPAKVAAIRASCEAAPDPDSVFAESVVR